MTEYDIRRLRGDIDPDEPPCEDCGVPKWMPQHDHIHEIVVGTQMQAEIREITGDHSGPHLHVEFRKPPRDRPSP